MTVRDIVRKLKPMTSPEAQIVRLTSTDWIKLIATITTACIGMVVFSQGQINSMRDSIQTLDDKWQTRMMGVERRLSDKIETVEARFPPTWLIDRLDSMDNKIDKINERLNGK